MANMWIRFYKVIYKVKKRNTGKDLRCKIFDEEEINLIR